LKQKAFIDGACRQKDTDGVMYLFVRYGHLIRHGVAVPPSPTGEGFFVTDVSSDFIHSPPYANNAKTKF